MSRSQITRIWNAAMGQPTLELALRLAETQTYDLLRDMGLSMKVASDACDDVMKDVVRYYKPLTTAELVSKHDLLTEEN